MKLIFQLGTNNWQREGEPAPGSGILHESQHNIMNSMAGVKCYSMFPSPVQKATSADYRVFHLDHPIPVCESASPTSSYRWHSMTDQQITDYCSRLENEVFEFMEEIEQKEGQGLTLAIAHHAFLNPLVMRNVIRRRVAAGKERTPICCHLHGTGLKMFENEMSGKGEYPLRFHKKLVEEKVFDDLENGVAVCYAVSPALVTQMATIFPTFPKDRIIDAPCGVNQKMFRPRQALTLADFLQSLGAPNWPAGLDKVDASAYDKTVVFAGKLADWKRIDALLLAAKTYESKLERICTLVIGGGPEDMRLELVQKAEDLGLQSVYLMGPRSQEILAQAFSVATVGVFPSFEEPFGMVFIECMACGTPVIGVASGGPKSLVVPAVGALVPEPGLSAIEPLAQSLAETVEKAVQEGWKSTKGSQCIKYIEDKFTAVALTADHLEKALTIATGLSI